MAENSERCVFCEIEDLLDTLRTLIESTAEALGDSVPSGRDGGGGRARHGGSRARGKESNRDDEDDCPRHHPHPHPRPCPPDPHCGDCEIETIVDGTLTVPAQKPDIERILRFDPTCRITHWEEVRPQGRRKIVVSGIVEIGVEYVAQLPDQSVHFAHFLAPFHTFFLCRDQVDDVRCEVEYSHYELLDPRTISKLVLLHVWAEH